MSNFSIPGTLTSAFAAVQKTATQAFASATPLLAKATPLLKTTITQADAILRNYPMTAALTSCSVILGGMSTLFYGKYSYIQTRKDARTLLDGPDAKCFEQVQKELEKGPLTNPTDNKDKRTQTNLQKWTQKALKEWNAFSRLLQPVIGEAKKLHDLLLLNVKTQDATFAELKEKALTYTNQLTDQLRSLENKSNALNKFLGQISTYQETIESSEDLSELEQAVAPLTRLVGKLQQENIPFTSVDAQTLKVARKEEKKRQILAAAASSSSSSSTSASSATSAPSSSSAPFSKTITSLSSTSTPPPAILGGTGILKFEEDDLDDDHGDPSSSKLVLNVKKFPKPLNLNVPLNSFKNLWQTASLVSQETTSLESYAILEPLKALNEAIDKAKTALDEEIAKKPSFSFPRVEKKFEYNPYRAFIGTLGAATTLAILALSVRFGVPHFFPEGPTWLR